MNIVFWILVVLVGLAAWVGLSFLFKRIGSGMTKAAENVKDNIFDEDEKGN